MPVERRFTSSDAASALVLLTLWAVPGTAQGPTASPNTQTTFSSRDLREDLRIVKSALAEGDPGLYRLITKTAVDDDFAIAETSLERPLTDTILLCGTTFQCDRASCRAYRSHSPWTTSSRTATGTWPRRWTVFEDARDDTSGLLLSLGPVPLQDARTPIDTTSGTECRQCLVDHLLGSARQRCGSAFRRLARGST